MASGKLCPNCLAPVPDPGPFRCARCSPPAAPRPRKRFRRRRKWCPPPPGASPLDDLYAASSRVARLPCAVCGAGRALAHHWDYARPADVVFLCRKHHAALHANLRRSGRHDEILNRGDLARRERPRGRRKRSGGRKP